MVFGEKIDVSLISVVDQSMDRMDPAPHFIEAREA
jgi:hypothetical protein